MSIDEYDINKNFWLNLNFKNIYLILNTSDSWFNTPLTNGVKYKIYKETSDSFYIRWKEKSNPKISIRDLVNLVNRKYFIADLYKD